ncbi:probable membrane-associated kinase regulator 5 [Cucurbita moschata]|uniref:Probable membrane-associated kinase regulator 5 n=1 Tax=Cucurbita moschata TaxID=3662 RepID=A0A6J1H2I5_CUCMO|nr:probable membrane-associated kinase regulator 5 [Cucurbita moschata]
MEETNTNPKSLCIKPTKTPPFFTPLLSPPTMDSLAFRRLFKLSVADEQQKREQDGEEEEDSFFDLEFLSVSAGDIHSPEQRPQIPTKLGEHINLCSDSISKRKILPIEPTSKPHSPIQLLKSAPKFPVSIFNKQRSMAKNRAPGGTEQVERRVLSSNLSRDNSTRRIGGVFPVDPCEAPATTARRFSKEAVQKYLRLIKPKVLKKPTDYSDNLSTTVDSPAREKHDNGLPAGIRLVCKHLGKSKSASATGGLAVAPPLNRRDDSLLQQHDGIQSAILHCKRSFNASTEKPLLFSRSETAASQERSRSLSCKDFSFRESKEEGI